MAKVTRCNWKLHRDSTKHVLPILLEFPGTLQTSATENIFHSEALLCRPCVRSTEKLQKLRADLREDFFLSIFNDLSCEKIDARDGYVTNTEEHCNN